MTDNPVADRNEQLDQTSTLAEREQEARRPHELKAAERKGDAREPDTLRIVRAI